MEVRRIKKLLLIIFTALIFVPTPDIAGRGRGGRSRGGGMRHGGTMRRSGGMRHGGMRRGDEIGTELGTVVAPVGAVVGTAVGAAADVVIGTTDVVTGGVDEIGRATGGVEIGTVGAGRRAAARRATVIHHR